MSEQKFIKLKSGDMPITGRDELRKYGKDWEGVYNPGNHILTPEDLVLYEYRRPITEPANGLPAGLPDLPKPPKGYEWEYRRRGWNNNGKPTRFASLYSKFTKWIDYSGSDTIPTGTCEYYAEAVQAVKQPSEPDYTSKEYQDAFRREWAADPTISRDQKLKTLIGDWHPNKYPELWSGDVYFYRPRQKPKVKSIEELDNEAATNWRETTQLMSYEQAFLAGAAYARQPKEVAK